MRVPGLTQEVSDFTRSLIFWKVESGEHMTVRVGWLPPCFYMWSDKGQEQSKTESPNQLLNSSVLKP